MADIIENGLAVRRSEPPSLVLSDSDVQLVKDTICRGASDQEFRLFIAACQRYRLDPLKKQIYAIKRWDATLNREVMSWQTGIDGMRSKAQETGKYRGQTATQWCGPEGKWADVWLAEQPPAAARVGVIRSDFAEPMYGVATFRAYAQRKKDGSPTAMWAKMPDVMLAKCAEALALRKAFPDDLGGLYTDDEMAQSAGPAASTHAPAEPAHPAPSPDLTPRQALAQVMAEWSGLTPGTTEYSRACADTIANVADTLPEDDRAGMVPGKMTDAQIFKVLDWAMRQRDAGVKFSDTMRTANPPPHGVPATPATTPSSAPTTPPAQPAAASGPDMLSPCTVKVIACEMGKSGTTGGRKWQMWKIATDCGEFTTFSSTVARAAADHAGKRCKLIWTDNGRGRAVDAIEPESPAPSEDIGEVTEDDIPF